jgi:hypothetical protein
MKRSPCLFVALIVIVVTGCASNSRPKLPYPAFVQADELPDVFLAAMPGVRAKPLAGDMRTRTSSNLISLPPDWKGTTGGSPGKSVELYVVTGELKLSEFVVKKGGYAYVPPGSFGFSLETEQGAEVLYFQDDVDENSVIRSPLILNSDLIDWVAISPGRYTKELRSDPGSGARSWLLRIELGATVQWTASSVVREGLMLYGEYQDSECFNGEAQTWQYLPGGYFLRPPETYNGGPEAIATLESAWFLREQSAGVESTTDVCIYTPPLQPD